MSGQEGVTRGDALAFLLGIVTGIILASILLDRPTQEKPVQRDEEAAT